MKITVQINGEPVEITLTEEQVAFIEEQKKPKQFEMDYSSCFYVAPDCVSNGNEQTNYIEHGRYRKTKESAEMSLARNKRANRLEALVDQLDGLRKFAYGEENWYVYKSDYTWIAIQTRKCFSPEVVYMAKECAIKVCEILNNGEYEL